MDALRPRRPVEEIGDRLTVDGFHAVLERLCPLRVFGGNAGVIFDPQHRQMHLARRGTAQQRDHAQQVRRRRHVQHLHLLDR